MLIEQNSYLTAHELINFWLPLVMAFGTLVGLIVRGWLVAKKGVSKWANTILNNQVIIIDKQLGHLQETTDKASTAVVELAKFHKDMLESQRGLVVMQSSLLATMIDMRTDFQAHIKDDLFVQNAILVGIKEIKAKTKTRAKASQG